MTDQTQWRQADPDDHTFTDAMMMCIIIIAQRAIREAGGEVRLSRADIAAFDGGIGIGMVLDRETGDIVVAHRPADTYTGGADA